VIFNLVPYHLIERIKEAATSILREYGISNYGIIPDKAELMSPTLLDITTALDAEILEGGEYLSNIAEEILVGAMGPEAALKWVRRARNPVIVTAGDRTELILTLIEAKPSGIVLTGNLYPSIKVLAKAREKGIPLLLVPFDTYTTCEKIRELYGKVTPYSIKVKERVIIESIKEHVNIEKLLSDLGF